MVGLLWFDDDPNRDLRQKVGNAVQRYQEKFGRYPTVCYVHPSMVTSAAPSGNGTISIDIGDICLRVVPRRSVLKHHLWLGDEDERPAHS